MNGRRHLATTVALLAALAWGAVAVAPTTALAAQEREEILSYDVTVELRDGNELRVTEVITVRALGDQIRRGIYRDFPTSFPRSSGLGRIVAPFDVLEVTRDGSPEPWALERIGGPGGRGGVRVRIGDADVFLDEGIHRYTLRYGTSRWITFGDQDDQLYWNVTGNGWAFPIRSASVEVVFPRPVDGGEVEVEAWTGPEGSTASEASVARDAAEGSVRVATTAPLGPQEGLTVRVTFPRGVVLPPTPDQEAEWFRMDWGGYVDAAWVVGLVVLLYLFLWMRVGRDPARGPVVVRFEPPPGYSPAALGFLRRRGYHASQLTAALVSLAVKGTLLIEQDDGKWTLRRAAAPIPEDLPKDEARLLATLLGSRSTLTLSSGHSSRVRSAVKKLKRDLSTRLERHYFELNRKWFVAGVVLSLVGFAVLAWRERYAVPPEAWFMGVWLTFWTLGAGTLAYRVVTAWLAVFRGAGAMHVAGAVFITLFATPFVVAEVVVAGLLLTMVPLHLALAVVVLGGVNVLFYHLLERPTLRGRGVLDRLEGFRRFLTATEADRLDRLTPPERTPELFERYLPHAIALGVENEWSARFEGVLTAEIAAGTAGTAAAGAMAWYSGDRSEGFSGLASSLGSSFSSTLSSASSPPPSSGGGGGGGGGSSGGGGGGGGGGGW